MRRFLIFALALAIFAGCEKKPVAVIDGEKITDKMFERYTDMRMKEHQSRGANISKETLRDSALQQMITERLMLQGAKQKGIAVSAEEADREVGGMKQRMGEEKFKKFLADGSINEADFKENVKEKLVLARFLDSLVPSDAVTDDEIKEYYKTSPTPFLKPETVNVRFIQTKTEAEAMAILDEIKKSGFDTVAVKVADEKRALVSEYGWTNPDMFSAEIAAALKKIPMGAYGGPYKGADDVYLFSVKGKQDKGVKSLEESKDEIKALLLERKRQAAVAHWVAERKQTASIVMR